MAQTYLQDVTFLEAGPTPIEEYGMVGDGRSAAIISRAGTVAFLCWPRFDSASCFTALLGGAEHGAWRIAPEAASGPATRRYVGDTLLLETRFATEDGEVTVTDAMPVATPVPTLLRIVEGRSGAVPMRMVMAPRFGYGVEIPSFSRLPDGSGVRATAGLAGLVLRAPVPLEMSEFGVSARFTVRAGEKVAFVLGHAPDGATPPEVDAEAEAEETRRWWEDWAKRCTYRGPHADVVKRSLLTLKALVHRPTGGIVAAPTMSLPETLGGTRNWDYRYCWLRDSSLTVLALLQAGYVDEARAWADWLRRNLDYRPDRMRIMYGIGGERDLTEWEANWLPGYEGARPVRVGNGACDQLQIDVYGELAEALYQFHERTGSPEAWDILRTLVEHLETIWEMPDEGMWEVRGGRQRFTFSGLMAWVAFDRGIKCAERWSLSAPLNRWRAARARVHEEVCAKAFDAERNSFVQSFGSREFDASNLLLPQFGFLPADDPRVTTTITGIEKELVVTGFVRRYDTRSGVDGLLPADGAFMPCNFWMVGAFAMQGRLEEAHGLFEKSISVRNDLGLMAEEYDPVWARMLGNFPQGFSHLALVNAAFRLMAADGAAADPQNAAPAPMPPANLPEHA